MQRAVDVDAKGWKGHGGIGVVQRGERISAGVAGPWVVERQRAGKADCGPIRRAIGVAGEVFDIECELSDFIENESYSP